MNGRNYLDLSLDLPLGPAFMAVATASTEKAALAMGLGEKEAMQLTLAVEEVYSHLLEIGGHDERIILSCQGGIYYTEVSIVFPLKKLNLRAFNLASAVSLEDEAQLAEIGLLLASRMVDRLRLSLEGNRIRLSLYKEKSYPEAGGEKAPEVKGTDQYSVQTPGPEDLKSFCQGVAATQQTGLYPSFLRFPGKFVDMVKSGEYQALAALSGQKQVAGGIVWREGDEKIIECYGPYLFAGGREIAGSLLEGCLERVGRSRAPGVLCRYSPPGSEAEKYFEKLGSAVFYHSGGKTTERAALYRQICEDLGSRVWSHPDLSNFLREEYRKLFLPREIREVKKMGEQGGAHSVFSCEFDQGEVTLRPLLAGDDAPLNLTRHLDLFAGEKIKNIFFELDLGEEWHAHLAPALLGGGFKPCFVLPYAGKGDLLLLQYRAGEQK